MYFFMFPPPNPSAQRILFQLFLCDGDDAFAIRLAFTVSSSCRLYCSAVGWEEITRNQRRRRRREKMSSTHGVLRSPCSVGRTVGWLVPVFRPSSSRPGIRRSFFPILSVRLLWRGVCVLLGMYVFAWRVGAVV